MAEPCRVSGGQFPRLLGELPLYGVLRRSWRRDTGVLAEGCRLAVTRPRYTRRSLRQAATHRQANENTPTRPASTNWLALRAAWLERSGDETRSGARLGPPGAAWLGVGVGLRQGGNASRAGTSPGRDEPGRIRGRDEPGPGRAGAGTSRGRDEPGPGRAGAGTSRGRDEPGPGRAGAGTSRGRDEPGPGRAGAGTSRGGIRGRDEPGRDRRIG